MGRRDSDWIVLAFITQIFRGIGILVRKFVSIRVHSWLCILRCFRERRNRLVDHNPWQFIFEEDRFLRCKRCRVESSLTEKPSRMFGNNHLTLRIKSDTLLIDGILSKCQNSDCEYDKDGFSVVYNQRSGSDSSVAAPTVRHRRRDKSCGAGDARRNSVKTDDGCQHPAIARPDKAQARRRTVCPVVGKI